MRKKLKMAILLAVDARDGRPFPEEALFHTAQMAVGDQRVTRAEFDGALDDLERGDYLQGLTHRVTEERTWSLTQAGRHVVAEIR